MTTRPARKGLQPNRDYAGSAAAVEKEFGAFKAPPKTINLDTVALAGSSFTFTFRHLRYTVHRLPWFDGVQLEYIRDEVVRMMQLTSTREHMETLVTLFEQGQAIMWRWARPRGWWWRGRWRNPFAMATYAEFMQLSSFFSECQMLLPDLALDTTPGSLTWMNRRRRWTLLTVFANSRKRSRDGSAGMGIRSVMSTIALDSGGLK